MARPTKTTATKPAATAMAPVRAKRRAADTDVAPAASTPVKAREARSVPTPAAAVKTTSEPWQAGSGRGARSGPNAGAAPEQGRAAGTDREARDSECDAEGKKPRGEPRGQVCNAPHHRTGGAGCAGPRGGGQGGGPCRYDGRASGGQGQHFRRKVAKRAVPRNWPSAGSPNWRLRSSIFRERQPRPQLLSFKTEEAKRRPARAAARAQERDRSWRCRAAWRRR